MDRSSIPIALLICIFCLIHYCNGANYGEDCSSSDCVDNSFQKCDSNKTCVCEIGYSVNSDNDGCVAELGKTCNPQVGCADQAATCTGSICSCNSSTHYDSNGNEGGGACNPRISLGSTCPDPSTTGDPTVFCTDDNAECRQDGGSDYTCLCNTGFSESDGSCVQAVDGGWTTWLTWTSCNVTCGGGSQSRSRSCTNPPPSHTGSECAGESTSSQSCNNEPCPIDGGWTTWLAWTSCSVTCGGGSQSRSRSCTNPPPSHTGSECAGESTSSQSCNSEPCPIDGGWTTWLAWTSCSLTCGGGSQSRSRSCTNPPPSNGGSNCTGTSTDSQSCNTAQCPVVPHGDPCQVGGDKCAGDNTQCNGGTCQCIGGYYWNNTACVTKVSLGAVCPNPSNTGVLSTVSCSDSHATCQQDGSIYMCRCTSNYYDNNGDTNNGGQCILKKDLGVSCLQNADSCKDGNAVCNGKCVCKTGFYDSTGTEDTGGVCSSKVSLGVVCPNPSNTGVLSTASCSDSHATCQQDGSKYKCRCTSNYYDNNGDNNNDGQCIAKVQLDSTCPNPTTAVPATVTCSDSEATCVADGGGYKCKCPSNYYDSNGNNAGGQCIQKKSLGANCPQPTNQVPNTVPCIDTNARCKWNSGNHKCQCMDGYYDDDGTSNTGGTCTLKVSLGAECPNPTNTGVSNTVSCSDTHATCQQESSNSIYTCRCTSDYYDNNGNNVDGECTPKVALGSDCPMADACKQGDSHCVSRTCVCMNDYYDSNTDNINGGQCKARKALGVQCTEMSSSSYNSDQCKDQFATCNSSKICACNSGYHQEGNVCEANKANGEDCLGNTANECSDLSAECRGSKCTCKLSYYDDNGLTEGGKCQQISQLQVGSVVFSEIKTTSFSVSWSRPSGQLSNFVDNYSVQWSLKNSVNTQKSPDLTSSTITYVVNGVTPGKVYNVKIISHNTRTENGVERTTSVTKEQSAKPKMVGGITSTGSDLDVSDGNLKIVFTAASNGKSGYIVQLFDGTTEIATKTPGQSATTTTIQNYHDVDSAHRPLKNGYRYTVKIVTKSETFNNNGNKVVQSDAFEKVIKTVPKAPNRPESGSCGVTTDNSITVSWSPPSIPNGDIVQYYVMVYIGDQINSTRVSIDNETELTVDDLEPGTSYSFKLVTENEVANSTETNFISQGCKTKAKRAEAPKNIQISSVESRSFTVTWDKPGKLYSEENFGYVLQIKDDSDVCVTEILYKCSDCSFGSFQFSQLADMCTGITKNEQRTKADLDLTMTYNASLKPDILYKVNVTAINGAGRGYEAIETEKTLEEVPQKPTSVSITDLTATSFTVSWSIDEPRPGKTTFEVVVTADTPAISSTESVIGFLNRSTEVTGLEEYWNYEVKVRATTSKGSMESDTKNITTNSSAPGKVSKFMITESPNGNYTQMKVSWEAPTILERNGVIKEYKFEHNASETNNVDTFSQSASEDVYEKTLFVIPESYYRFKVTAFNTDNATGEPYEMIVMAPAGKPINIEESRNLDIIPVDQVSKVSQTKFTSIIKMTFFQQNGNGAIQENGLILCTGQCLLEDEVSLHDFKTWVNWKLSKGSPYRITPNDWLKASTGNRKKRSVTDLEYTVGAEDCTNVPDDDYCNGPLEPDTTYYLVAVTCTNGGCTLSKEYGPFVTAAVPPDPAPLWIIGVVAGVVAAAVVAVVVFIVIRRRRGPKQMDPVSNGGKGEIPELDPALASIQKKRPICLEEMEEYVQTMHKDSNLLFAREYEDLKALSPKHSCEAADREENRLKNRYINIIPFDNTRVKLNCMDEDDCSDYINANYLPGYRFKREYIACQGPIPGTIDDFWRMIWEQNVAIVVMLTLCKEGQKIKCEQYWPDVIGEPKQYGDVVAEVTTCSTIRTYDYRTFKMTRGNSTRIMKHFHFLSWLDFQANVSHDTILDFIDQVRSHVQPPDTSGPIIVHCSAGVGRTGTYICLDHLTQLIRDSDFNIEIDIFNMVLNLRNNRQHMVQTEQQYIFIHDCVLEIMERKRKACNIYENTGFSNDEENIYQNEEVNMYANVSLKNEQKTVL